MGDFFIGNFLSAVGWDVGFLSCGISRLCLFPVVWFSTWVVPSNAIFKLYGFQVIRFPSSPRLENCSHCGALLPAAGFYNESTSADSEVLPLWLNTILLCFF
jgi:hypothetical protein